MADDHLEQAARFLARNDITTYWVEPRRKHRALVVEHQGKRLTVIMPSTGSDRRGPANTVGELRRLLNLPRKERAPERPAEKVLRKPKRRTHAGDRNVSRLTERPVLLQIDRFYEPLAKLRAQLAAAVESPPLAPDTPTAPGPDFPAVSGRGYRLLTPWLGRRTRYLVN